MAFGYWTHWLSLDEGTIASFLKESPSSSYSEYAEEVDGLVFHDGYHPTFWYVLNMPWYEMSNKHSASTNNKFPFQTNVTENLVDWSSEFRE